MNTPITRKLWTAQDDESFVEHTARIKDGMSRLETDRAELMEALEKLARLGNGNHYGNSEGNDIAKSALTAAHANFPKP